MRYDEYATKKGFSGLDREFRRAVVSNFLWRESRLLPMLRIALRGDSLS
jgi:hypothetical protein